MEEIKLKFWCEEHGFVKCGFDGPLKEVYFDQHGNIGAPCPLCHKHRPMKVVLFTGLQDNVGTDIYSGDILFVRSRYVVVEWIKVGARFTARPVNNTLTPFSMSTAALGKVVGNIYENPELL